MIQEKLETFWPGTYPLLREFGAVFREDLPDAVFVIEGHADGKSRVSLPLSFCVW